MVKKKKKRRIERMQVALSFVFEEKKKYLSAHQIQMDIASTKTARGPCVCSFFLRFEIPMFIKSSDSASIFLYVFLIFFLNFSCIPLATCSELSFLFSCKESVK